MAVERAADRHAVPEAASSVVQVLPALSGRRGRERDAVEIAAALVAAGRRAMIVSAGGPLVHALARVGAEHVALPTDRRNPLALFATARRIADIVRTDRFDVVHAHDPMAAVGAWWAARRTGCHFVTTVHEADRSRTLIDHRLRTVMATGERVIAVSRFVATDLRRSYGVPETRVRVIPPGIDLDRFDPARVTPDRLAALASRWRLTDGVPMVMLVGGLVPHKGQTVLVDAVHRLGRRDIHCLLVGAEESDPACRQALETQIDGYGLGGVVRIVDHCDDMAAAYMLADIVVSASTAPEAFARSLIEAQAIERPVIAADHGGAREIVAPGRTGWLIPAGDAAALSAAIETVLGLAPEERRRIVAAAAAEVRAGCSKAAMCQRTLATYDELRCGTGDHPAPGRVGPEAPASA